MGSLSTSLLQLLIFIVLFSMPLTDANNMYCSVSADIREFERYFGKLKEMLHNMDKNTDVSLLRTNELKQILPYERCCFLLKLGHFYVSTVFPEVEPTLILQHQDFTHLANYILGLKKRLKECQATLRCPCGAQSHTIMKNFKDDYFKMETKAATIKAIGELNILFHWMDMHYLN